MHQVGHILGGRARENPNYRLRSNSHDKSLDGIAKDLSRTIPYVPLDHKTATVGKNDTHVGNILSSTYLKEQAAKGGVSMSDIKGGFSLGEIEAQNRYKYGVKKPANRWKHEMDDSRITGAHVRTNNFKTTMFDLDEEAGNPMRPAGIPIRR